MHSHSLLGYFLRYFFSGILTTLIHLGSLVILVHFASIEPIKASVASFCLASVYNYIFQYYWAFKVATSHWQFFSRYLSVHIITLGINTAMFWLFSEQIPHPYFMIQLYVSACIIVLNVLVNGHFIYNTFKSNGGNSKPLVSKKYLITFLRYFISGGLAVLIHFGTLILLIETFGISPVTATTIGFCLAVLFNYTAQYYWTFKVKGSHQQIMLRFLVVTAFTLMINTGLFWLMHHQFKFPYLVSQLFATGTVFFLNFFINHHYTFNTQNVSQDVTDPA